MFMTSCWFMYSTSIFFIYIYWASITVKYIKTKLEKAQIPTEIVKSLEQLFHKTGTTYVQKAYEQIFSFNSNRHMYI